MNTDAESVLYCTDRPLILGPPKVYYKKYKMNTDAASGVYTTPIVPSFWGTPKCTVKTNTK